MTASKHVPNISASVSLVPVSVCDVTVDAGCDDVGTVWVSVRRICDALGIDVQGQTRKLREKRWAGVELISTPSTGGTQTTYCIPLRSLPMWLATIESSRVSDEARATLERFQVEAADVLANHFMGKGHERENAARDEPPTAVSIPSLPPDLMALEKARLLDKLADSMAPVISPEAVAVMRAHGAAALTGEPVKTFLPLLPAGKWYRPTEIAEMLGVTVARIGRTITSLGLRGNSERCKTIMDTKANGSGQVACYLYDQTAFDMIDNDLNPLRT